MYLQYGVKGGVGFGVVVGGYKVVGGRVNESPVTIATRYKSIQRLVFLFCK